MKKLLCVAALLLASVSSTYANDEFADKFCADYNAANIDNPVATATMCAADHEGKRIWMVISNPNVDMKSNPYVGIMQGEICNQVEQETPAGTFETGWTISFHINGVEAALCDIGG